MLLQPSAPPFLVSLLLVLCVALPVHAADKQSPGPQPVLQFSAASTEPVIEYNLVHHLLAQQDPVPLLRVYGDGRVHVHFPAYMKRAGDYEMVISRVQLNDLLRQLTDDGVMDFDPATVKQEKQQLEAARRAATGELFHISDATDTYITVKLAQYQRSLASPRISDFSKQFRWRNLNSDAHRYPQSTRLTRAANAAAILRTVCEHPALRKLP
ncbi:MAG: hypothetical protein HKP57_03385 [Halobacteria archaeon]|nr:hypothetical protein [Halobacteria archaeon]